MDYRNLFRKKQVEPQTPTLDAMTSDGKALEYKTTGKVYRGQMKESPQLAATIAKMQEEFDQLAAMPGAEVIQDCVTVPMYPFNPQQLIKYPWMLKAWYDLNTAKPEDWVWSKWTFQSYTTDDDGKHKAGDIIGLLLLANGHWQVDPRQEDLDNYHYFLAEKYPGSDSLFWYGVECGFDYRPDEKDLPGWDVGNCIREYFHKELKNER